MTPDGYKRRVEPSSFAIQSTSILLLSTYLKTSISKLSDPSAFSSLHTLTIFNLSEVVVTFNLQPTMAYKTGLLCLLLALGPAAVLSVPMPEVSL